MPNYTSSVDAKSRIFLYSRFSRYLTENFFLNTFSPLVFNPVFLNLTFNSSFYIENSNRGFYQHSLVNDNDNIDFFNIYRRSLFNAFFMQNMLDVPICFKKSKSLKRNRLSLPLLKFVNHISKNGKNEQYCKIIFKTFMQFFEIKPNNDKFIPLFLSTVNWKSAWFSLLHFFELTSITKKIVLSLTSEEQNLIEKTMTKEQVSDFRQNHLYLRSSFTTPITDFGKTATNLDDFKNLMYLKLMVINPVFNFFVFNVDKNIRKFARGKTGKYVFIWKFIPLHKRNALVLKLIKKNINFNNGKKLTNRLFNLLTQIFFEPQKTFLWKNKIFIYNYVFKNFKKSLMLNLRTIR